MEEYKEIYSRNQADRIASEFTKLKDNYYLEHVGATIYSDTQIANVFEDLKNNLFGNPHAFNNSSKFTEDVIDQVRYQVLEHFNTNLDEYSIIFTSGATGALKLVAENFNYYSTNSTRNNEECGTFTYLEDNHTSVLGMREYAKNIKTLSHEEAFKIFNTSKSPFENIPMDTGHSLFVYPAQCNFSGTKYPLSWIDKVQNGILNTLPQTNHPTKWFCMLDAASFVSCNKLDLNKFKPDFVCLSFYKIFGYPTGLGALLVKNTSGHVLTKTYFGGGTVQMTLHSEHILRSVIHERFEDGTLPFLSITSVRHGFETFKRLSLDMEMISTHTFSLAKYVHHSLLLLHHSNGNPIAVLYHDTNFENKTYQGAIVNFNLLRANGQYIGYSEVLQMANLYNIHLRTGCLCNPGACQRHLKLSPADVKQHFEAGHVCGDQNDLIDGYPTGSVRISFGYMSTKTDADKLLQMIQDCFILKPVRRIIPSTWLAFEKRYKQKFCATYDEQIYSINNNKPVVVVKANVENTRHIEHVIKENNIDGIVQHIFVYPIKSCGPYSVEKSWKIEATGLSYDREWMIVTSAGVCLTQKREPRMCLVMPIIKTDEGVMELHFPNMHPINVPLHVGDCMSNSEVTLCQNKVCGDRVRCFDCGDEVAHWLSEALERSDLRLVRQNSNHPRTNRKGEQSQLSLANQAQFLLLNLASVRYLKNSIQDYADCEKDISNLMHRFRANIVIDSTKAFIENSSDVIIIRNHEFKCTGPCTRCQMICIDQTTGEKTIEPLRTLSVLTESKIRFGVYLAHVSATDTALSVHETVSFQ